MAWRRGRSRATRRTRCGAATSSRRAATWSTARSARPTRSSRTRRPRFGTRAGPSRQPPERSAPAPPHYARHMPPFALSVLDQSPVSEGMTGAEALRNTVELARLTDALGYERYWVAEHHGTPMLASASPEALIGPSASATERIRVGSGGVMLPHYSPLKVAETFSVLSGLFPGRI